MIPLIGGRTSLERFEPPLLVCEPVLTEAAFLLSRHFGTADDLFELIERGILRVAFSLVGQERAVRLLMRRYHDVPISLADACIVRMAELHSSAVVWTLDSDFRIYRKNGRQMIPTVFPK